MTHASQRRPWVAALLGLVVTGLGHVYLRRWLRACYWFVLGVGLSLLLLPRVGTLTPIDFIPVLGVVVLSAADAYVLALLGDQPGGDGATPDEVATVRCPRCGRETDTTLAFCHWCTTPFDATPS